MLRQVEHHEIEVQPHNTFSSEIQNDLRVETDGPGNESCPSKYLIYDFQRSRIPGGHCDSLGTPSELTPWELDFGYFCVVGDSVSEVKVLSGWIGQSSHVNDSPEFYVLGHGICKTGMEMGVAYSKV